MTAVVLLALLGGAAAQPQRSADNIFPAWSHDGSDVRRCLQTPHDDTTATWSPGGKRIVFASDRDGNAETSVMNADGSNQARLTGPKNGK